MYSAAGVISARVFPWVVIVQLLSGVSIKAQEKSSLAAAQVAVHQQQENVARGQSASPETLHILAGRSLEIRSTVRITRVSVTDPAIVDPIVVNPNQVLISGKTPGVSSLVLWDESGQTRTYDVFVDLDLEGLRHMLQTAFPNEAVHVEARNEVVALSGRVSSQAIADKILETAKATSAKVVNLMEVAAPVTTEILLQVKFAEVDREAIKQLGVNILSLPGAKNVGTVGTGQFGPPSIQGGGLSGTTGGFNLSDLLNIFIFRPDINLALTIKALQEQNVLQILAEPNVMTESGKDASFLAGGEFPYPVVQGTTGVPTVTILFREFGVKLDFTPTLTADGLIHLKVKPEVSSLDFTNALTIQGFLIPALSTRRVQSEMDLRDGQSFAIAGLVDNRLTDTLEKIPGLGDIPLLGKLFQSRSLTKTNSELLVLVTPRIVRALPPDEAPAGPKFPIPFLPPGPAQEPGTAGHN